MRDIADIYAGTLAIASLAALVGLFASSGCSSSV
jgi:hypothetical protein